MEAATRTSVGGVVAPSSGTFSGGGSGGGCCAGTPPPIVERAAAALISTRVADQHDMPTTTAEQAGFAAATAPTPTAAATVAAAGARHRGGVAGWKYNDSNNNNSYPYPYYYSNSNNNNNSNTDNINNSNNNNNNSSGTISSRLRSSSDLTSEIEIIKEAQKAFKCPEGFKLAAIPPPSASRSVIYMYGVRVDEIQAPPGPAANAIAAAASASAAAAAGGSGAAFPTDQSKSPHHARKVQKPSGRYYCLASESCRESQTYLKLPKGGTSSATDHLGNLHGPMFKVKSADAAEAISGANQGHPPDATVQRQANLQSFKEDKDRFLVLHYVKTCTVNGFQPFDWMEDAERRLTMDLMNDGHFRMEMLKATRIKQAIVEMYEATKRSFVRSLTAELKSARTRILHVAVDVWTAGTSVHPDKYIGLRVFLLAEDFTEKSFLLAVKRYKPAPTLTGEQVGGLVRLWAEQALAEFGLDWTMVAGAVTDGGSDLKFAFRNIPGVLEEGCIAHMLNRATIDGFGMSSSPAKCTNTLARQGIAQVRKVAEHMNNSNALAWESDREKGHGSLPEGALRQAVSQRWSEATVLLERVLVYYSDLVQHSVKYEGSSEGEPLGVQFKREVEEIFSVMKYLQLVVQGNHSARLITSVPAMSRLVMLLTKDLNVERPLALHEASSSSSPSSSSPPEGAARPASAAPTQRTEKKHAELTATGQATRVLTHEAVWKRFGSKRYGEGLEGSSHLFDMAMALNPGCRALGYIDVLSPTTSVANRVKAKVWAQLASRVGEVIAAERATASARSNAASGIERAWKRSRPTPSTDTAQLLDMKQSGLYDGALDSSGDESEEEDNQAVIAEARMLVSAWRNQKIPKALRNVSDSEGLAMFWRTYGRKTFREISEVARAVLGAPATAAVLDRDFGDAGNLTGGGGGQCEPLDSAYVEMTMFLHGAYGFIPTSIPALSSEDFEGSIPVRLRDTALRKEVAGLSGEPPEGQSVDAWLPFGGSDSDQDDCEERAERGPEDWRRA